MVGAGERSALPPLNHQGTRVFRRLQQTILGDWQVSIWSVNRAPSQRSVGGLSEEGAPRKVSTRANAPPSIVSLPAKSKVGCQTCLTKKVKCDEQRPNCGRCVRLKLECEWASSKPSLASRRRGFGPIKDRCSWTPPTIVAKEIGEHTQNVPEPSSQSEASLDIQLDDALPDPLESPGSDIAGLSLVPAPMVPFAPIADLTNLVLLPEDAIDVGQEQQSHQDDIDLSTQLTLFPFPSFSLFSALSSISFTLPMDPAPSIGTSDSQAVAFHRTVLAPMKSTQVAAVSSHTLFLDFAIQNRMALHLLLAFSHSELAIHQGFSDRPPLESYLHFQHGSQLFTQQLEYFVQTNHIAMMLSFLYLYMFWMRRHPFDVSRLKELSTSVLVYVRAFTLDELCASDAPNTVTSEPAILSRILTYIYDRDVFCGFFGCGEAFAMYVDENHEKRQRIWQLSRLPFSNHQSTMWPGSGQSSESHHRMILDVYFALITLQREINRYSQGSEAQSRSIELGIKRKLDRIREVENHSQILNTTLTHSHRSTPSSLNWLPMEPSRPQQRH